MKILLLFVAFFSTAFSQPILRIYTTDIFASGVGENLKKEFEKKHKVKIHYITCNGASSLYQDLKHGKKQTDGFIGLSYDLFGSSSIKEHLREHQINSKLFTLPFSWSEKNILPVFYSALCFVSRGEFPDIVSFDDLPKLKKKIILIDPRTSHPGFGLLLWIKSIYGEKSAAYWKSIRSCILTMTKTWSEAYALFMQKESPIVLSYTTSPAYHHLKEHNDEIHSIRFSEGQFLQIYVGGILQRSKQPALMKKFLLYTLSPESQKRIVFEDWSYPVVDIGESLPKEFQKQDDFKMPFSPETIERNKKKWISEWLNAIN